MRKLVFVFLVAPFVSAALVLGGCHADKNDPAGQAEELKDPVRRHNAISNLTRIYTQALDCCKKVENDEGVKECKSCSRDHEKVQKIADTIYDELTQVYVDHPEDTANGKRILQLLNQMRDPRTLPALVKALDWRTEVTEEHAILAAKTIQHIDVPDNKVGEVVEALSKALDKVSGARGIDNRMRINFIRALGSLDSKKATKTLEEIVATQSEDQDFLINRLAARELGELGDPDTVDTMIKGLFMFDPQNPGRRMNDVAAEALVRIGRPAFKPVLKVLRGNHETANRLAKQYIAAIKERNEQAADQMSVENLTTTEATYVLGMLGFPDALEPLIEVAESDEVQRQINAAVALVQLNVEPEQQAKIRKVIRETYDDAPTQAKPQLIASIRHMYDPEMLSFLLGQAKDEDLHPQIRLEAVKAYALLANASETKKLREFIQDEPKSEEGGYREKFAMFEPALQVSEKCNEDVQCWLDRVENPTKGLKQEEDEDNAAKVNKESLLLRKAAYMIGRLGRGDKEAANKLVSELLDHDDVKVRMAALWAIDHIAVEGNEKAVAKIDKLREKEQGQSVWESFKKQALPIQARLRTRTA